MINKCISIFEFGFHASGLDAHKQGLPKAINLTSNQYRPAVSTERTTPGRKL